MIIFLHGADTFRSRRFLRELKEKFNREIDPGSSSLNVVDGQTADLTAIREKINTGSLFAKKRFTVIENIFKNKSGALLGELEIYLKKLPEGENDIIIFRDEEVAGKNKKLKTEAQKLFKFLAAQLYSQEFSPLVGGPLLNFIKKEAAVYGATIDSAAADRLVALTNGDTWLIAGEIKKLVGRAAGAAIDAAAVQEMVAGADDENIFGLTDALSAKNKKLALELLEKQYAAGLSDEYLITMLIRQFRILLQIRVALDNRVNPAGLASELNLHPYVVRKGEQQAKNFSADQLKDYLNRLINLDARQKTGRGDAPTELALLIAGL